MFKRKSIPNGWSWQREKYFRKYRLVINCQDCPIRDENCGVPNHTPGPCDPKWYEHRMPWDLKVRNFIEFFI